MRLRQAAGSESPTTCTLAQGQTCYGYYARGNLTNDGTRVMVYDLFNRLLTVTGSGINVKLEYDPEGRLAKYSINGGSSWTTFLYDGVNLIGEYAGTPSTISERYIHGTGTDEPLAWLNGSRTGAVRYFWQNYQGSVVLWSEGANVVARYKYGPYGEPLNAANVPSFGGARFRYTGQTVLPEVQLYYYKARVYDPMMGRFLQTDPIGSKDDLNLYAYTGGDPVNKTDPDGMESGAVSVQGLQSMMDARKERPYSRLEVEVVGMIADEVPIVGEIKSAVEFVREPTWKNAGLGVAGILPFGKFLGKFGDRAKLVDHFARHGGDFGAKSAKQYEKMAGQFLLGKPGQGVLQTTRKNGDVIRFDPKTDQFGVVSKDGTIKTYYKPDPNVHGYKTNLEYFNAQK